MNCDGEKWGRGKVPNASAYMKPSCLGTAPTQCVRRQLRSRPLKAASHRPGEKTPGKKPLTSGLSFDLLTEQQGHLHLLPHLSKSPTTLMNLAPNPSPRVADIPKNARPARQPPNPTGWGGATRSEPGGPPAFSHSPQSHNCSPTATVLGHMLICTAALCLFFSLLFFRHLNIYFIMFSSTI